MTRTHNNKLRMFKATYEVLNDNSIAVSSIPAFTAAIASFAEVLSGIQEKEVDRSRALGGKTLQKDLSSGRLGKVVVAVASALYLLGRQRNDSPLMASMSLKDSDFKLMRDADRERVATEILTKAIAEKESLEQYGAAPGLIERLTLAHKEYADALAASSTSIPARSNAGSMVEEYFLKGDDILRNQLDRFALIARGDHPEFYRKYQAARIIKDLGGRKVKDGEEQTAAVTAQA